MALRRWYVVVAGLLLTVAVANCLVRSMPVVYAARSSVTVMRPDANPIRVDGTETSGVAVILNLVTNGGAPEPKRASPDTTMYGEGIYDGSRVRIRDAGGQWAVMVDEPVLYVEAVGPTPEVVTERINGHVADLSSRLTQLQRGLGVEPEQSIYMHVSPDEPVVERLSGNRARLLAAIIAIGLALTAAILPPADRLFAARAQPGGRRGARDDNDPSTADEG